MGRAALRIPLKCAATDPFSQASAPVMLQLHVLFNKTAASKAAVRRRSKKNFEKHMYVDYFVMKS